MATVEQPPFPIVVGAGRSGTTLLRVMLSRHPDLALPPESWWVIQFAKQRERYDAPGGGFDLDRYTDDLLAHRRFRDWQLDENLVRARLRRGVESIDLAEAYRQTYALFAEAQGKSRAGEKTPNFVNHMPELLELFPTARFIHIQRDGRDVAASVVEMPWGPSLLSHAAIQWRNRILRGRHVGTELGPDRYLEVRYEDLVADPGEGLQRICAFIELDFDEVMLDQDQAGVVPPREQSYHPHLAEPVRTVRDWRTEMRSGDVALVELIAGDALELAGYELVSGPPSTTTKLRAEGGRIATKVGRLRRRTKRRLAEARTGT